MGEVRIDVNREAVERHPALHPHPERSDLRLPGPSPTQIPMRPSARCALTPNGAKAVDHPLLERMNEAADVLSALVEVEHDIADPLPRPVVGVTAAAAGLEHRKAERIDELGRVGAGPGGEQRRVLEQPHAFGARSRRESPPRAHADSLRRAIQNEEFLLHYQPRVSVDSLAITGVEALVRWQHPQLVLFHRLSLYRLRKIPG